LMAARLQETGTGGFVGILVIGILLASYSIVILANLGGYRDGHASRIMRQRAAVRADRLFGPPNAKLITVWQVIGGVVFLLFALVMIVSAVANLT
jgi:hypothetical protein